jgi:hypothetical protein
MKADIKTSVLGKVPSRGPVTAVLTSDPIAPYVVDDCRMRIDLNFHVEFISNPNDKLIHQRKLDDAISYLDNILYGEIRYEAYKIISELLSDPELQHKHFDRLQKLKLLIDGKDIDDSFN